MENDHLATALGVRPMSMQTKVIEPTEIIQVHEQSVGTSMADADLDTARRATHDALDKGLTALDEIMAVAKVSEHPRAYEVVANMVNTVTAAAEQLMRLQKLRQEIVTPEDKQNEPGKQVNVVVMSTSDMLRQIRQELGK